MYSIGSSIVNICSLRVSFIWSIMEASEVDLPDPVGPVTSINPLICRVMSCATAGKPRSSILGISVSILRSTAAWPVEEWNRLTRNRKSPMTIARSNSRSRSKFARDSSFSRISRMKVAKSSKLMISSPKVAIWPLTLMEIGRSAWICRSESSYSLA